MMLASLIERATLTAVGIGSAVTLFATESVIPGWSDVGDVAKVSILSALFGLLALVIGYVIHGLFGALTQQRVDHMKDSNESRTTLMAEIKRASESSGKVITNLSEAFGKVITEIRESNERQGAKIADALHESAATLRNVSAGCVATQERIKIGSKARRARSKIHAAEGKAQSVLHSAEDNAKSVVHLAEGEAKQQLASDIAVGINGATP